MVLKGLAQLVGRCAWVLEQADKHSLTCEPLSNLRLSLRVAGSSAFLTVLSVDFGICLGSNSRSAIYWPCELGQLI